MDHLDVNHDQLHDHDVEMFQISQHPPHIHPPHLPHIHLPFVPIYPFPRIPYRFPFLYYPMFISARPTSISYNSSLIH